MLGRMGWFLAIMTAVNGFALGLCYVMARLARVSTPGRRVPMLWFCAAINAGVVITRYEPRPLAGGIVVAAVVAFGEGWAWSFRRTMVRRGIETIEAIQRTLACEHEVTMGVCGRCHLCGIIAHWHPPGEPCPAGITADRPARWRRLR